MIKVASIHFILWSILSISKDDSLGNNHSPSSYLFILLRAVSICIPAEYLGVLIRTMYPPIYLFHSPHPTTEKHNLENKL